MWEYKEANPLYGDFTTKHWRKLDLYRFPERTDGDLYRGACISFGSDEELEQFVADNTTGKVLGIFGEETVNVLGVNLDIAEALGLIGGVD